MTGPTASQHQEMRELLAKSHDWIDTMKIAGCVRTSIVSAVHQALVERLLDRGRSGADCRVASYREPIWCREAGLGPRNC